jgi:hypothetical protein
MPTSIAFSLILNPNLELKEIALEQTEVVIDVNGDTDPLTHDMVRNYGPVNDCFQARRKNINDLITNSAKAIHNAKSKKQGETLLTEFNSKFKVQVSTFQTELQVRVEKFFKEDHQRKIAYLAGKITFKIHAIGALGKAGLFLISLVSFAQGEPTGDSTQEILLSWKDLIDLVKEGAAFATILFNLWKELSGQEERLKTALANIKKIKPPAPISESLADAVKIAIGAYNAKLLGIEMEAKQMAANLDKLLKKIDSGKWEDEGTLKQVEIKIDKNLHEIIRLNEALKHGRTLTASAQTQIKNVSARLKQDPKTYWNTLVEWYESFGEEWDKYAAYDDCTANLKKNMDDFSTACLNHGE